MTVTMFVPILVWVDVVVRVVRLECPRDLRQPKVPVRAAVRVLMDDPPMSVTRADRHLTSPEGTQRSPDVQAVAAREVGGLSEHTRDLLECRAQQHSQLSPFQESRPSLSATAAITRAATGSAHHQPASAFASKPTSSATER